MRTADQVTMLAITQDKFGSADVLTCGRIPRPAIADDEVLIRVHAAGVDRGALHLMTGRPYLLRILGFGFRRPKNPVLGREVAGVVAAVGSKVTRFAAGDDVFGIGEGTFAEYTAAKEDKLASKPASLTWEQAAAVPVSGSTAYQGLHDVGGVAPGDKVLVIGASGGVGSYVVQLAVAIGAEVTGVCSTSKVELVRSFGAKHVIDYSRADFAAGPQRYDLILDIGGNSLISKLRRTLTPTGTVVIVGGEEGGKWTGGFGRSLRAPALSPFVRQRLAMLVVKEDRSTLELLTDLIEAGNVTPRIDRSFPLDQTADAMRHLEAGNARGKLVISVHCDE